jgi:hypothetical protein
MRDDVGRIGEPPARPGEVESKAALLAPDLVALVEAAHLEHGVAADDRSARDEAEHARAGEARLDGQRAAGHERAHGIEGLPGADEHARGDHGQAGDASEHGDRPGERVRRPPRVVVAERDVRNIDSAQTDVPRRRAAVSPELQEVHGGEAVPDCRRVAVARAVVDDEHERRVGQPGQTPERGQERLAPVACHHDDGGPPGRLENGGDGDGSGLPIAVQRSTGVGGERPTSRDPRRALPRD